MSRNVEKIWLKTIIKDTFCILSYFFITIKHFFIGRDHSDPGQVPDGAKCGEDSYCRRSRCVKINRPVECDCKGVGVCDQGLQCVYNTRWTPANCSKFETSTEINKKPKIEEKKLWWLAGNVFYNNKYTLKEK